MTMNETHCLDIHKPLFDNRGISCEINWNGSSYEENSSIQYYAGTEHFKRCGLGSLDGIDIIIDIGTGNGRVFADSFSKTFAKKLIGIDPNQSMINEAKKNFAGIGKLEFYQGSAENFLEIKNKEGANLPKAGLICAHNVFHFVFDLNKCFRDVFQVLNDQGLFIVGIPSIVDPAIDNRFIGVSVMANLAESIFLNEFIEEKSQYSEATPWNFQPIVVYEQKLLEEKFEIVSSKIEIYKNRFLGGRKQLILWMKQVCPFVKYIRYDQHDKYFDRIADEYLKTFPVNDDNTVNVSFAQIEITAKKCFFKIN